MRADITAFLEHLAVTQKSPLTVRRYGDVLRDLADQLPGRVPDDVARDELRRFVVAPRPDGSPRSPAGANLRLAVVRAFWKYLALERGSLKNAAEGLTGVREHRTTPKYLSSGEERRLLEHVGARGGRNRDRDLAIVVVLWQTALRVSELARLTVGQLDLDGRVIRDVRVKCGHVVDVLLNEQTAAVLRNYLESRGEPDGMAPVIARRDGRPLSVRAIEMLFATWRRELGWTRPLHPHVLRHTHATESLEDGTDIATVAKNLRHADLRTVLVYAAVQERARRTALAKLGRRVPRELVERPPTTPSAALLAGRSSNARPHTDSTCGEEAFGEAA